jgi:NAD(P)-dependent dehydrogenase (short-subunit alcohol dehydrogenase family)
MSILQGKAVVITGSGRGIGAACAKGVARQGAAVVVNDIDAPEANETVAAIIAEGGTAVACVADVSKWEEAGRLIGTCISAFGKIDGLVNNAGLYEAARLEDFDPANTQSMVNTNVLGPLYCAAHAVKPMLNQKAGSIVNVVSGAHMGVPQLGAYGATKGAVASMVYTWSLELAGSGVRVNGLSPFGATRMGIPKDASPELVAKLHGNLQKPEANSPVVEFLLSDLANDVNGQLVRIDKGEIQLYTHPALLLPSVTRSGWTASMIAEVFKHEFKNRQVPSGVLAMKELPVEMQSGYWKRAGSAVST